MRLPYRELRHAALFILVLWALGLPALAQATPPPTGTAPPTGATAAPGPTTVAPTAPSLVTGGPGPSTQHGAYVEVPMTQAPVVDGALRERLWQDAPVLGNFALLSGGRRPLQATEVRVVYDDKAIYVGFHCQDTELASSKAVVTGRDDAAILNEDCVEVFLDAKRDRRTYYHIALSRAGGVLDEVAKLGPESATIEGLEAKAAVVGQAWEAEIAIPFAALGIAPSAGAIVNANFARTRSLDGEKSSWCLARGSFHDPYNFGEVALASKPIIAEVSDLGDTYGELRGGANAKVRLATAVSATVLPSVELLGGGYSRVFEVAPLDAPPSPIDRLPKAVPLDGSHAKRVEIPYYVIGAELTLCQVTVTDAAGQKVLFRSPRTPLRDTWLRPRYEKLADTLTAISDFANSLSQSDQAKPQVLAEVSKERPKLDGIRSMIESKDAWGSVARWGQIREAIIAAQKEIDSLSLAASLVKGRTPQETAAGAIPKYVVSGRDWMLPAVYNTVPEFADVKPRAYCFACPGETEPLSVLVTSSVELTSCTATLTDFVENTPSTPATGSFPASQATIRVVHCWEQASDGLETQRAGRVMVPELLLTDATREPVGPVADVKLGGPVSFNVRTWETRQLWIDVTVPEGTAPGLYESTLTVTPQGQPARSVALLVKVLGLRLAEPWQKWQVFLQNTLVEAAPMGLSKEVYAAYLADIRAHGFDQASVADPGGTLLEALTMREAAGLKSTATVSLESVPPHEAGAFVSTVRRLLSGKTVPDLLFYTIASPTTPAEAEAAIAVGKAIHDAGGKTITTVSPAMVGMLGDSLDVLLYDILQPDFENYDVAILKGEQTQDPRPEYYQVPGTAENPIVNRLLCGFYVEKSAMDGVYVSSYQDPAGCPDPFNETAAPGAVRPQMLTYPAKAGPIPTVQWEAAREGRDDMRYVATLEKAIQDAQAYSTNPDVAKAVTEGKAALDKIHKVLQVDWRFDLVGVPSDFYTKLRWEIAVKALRIVEAIAKPAVPAATVMTTTPAGTAGGSTGATTPPPTTGGTGSPPMTLPGVPER